MARAGWRPFALASIATGQSAYAAEYLSVEAAQRAAFPEATAFVPVPVAIDAAVRRKIAEVANPPGARDPLVWRATGARGSLGLFMVDAVIGKQEYITYAVAFDDAGRVLRLDVLQYRETHGYEIRNDRWRAQFVGKSAADPVALNSDIANISGATLSCRHVTDGVRRLLAIRALVA